MEGLGRLVLKDVYRPRGERAAFSDRPWVAVCSGFERAPLYGAERGASALGYVGMFLVAALIIGGLVLAASGVGQTLGCMLTNAITGDNAVCSINDPDDESLVPDKFLDEENSVSISHKTGIEVDVLVAGGGAGHTGEQNAVLRKYSDDSLILEVTEGSLWEVEGKAGKDLKGVADVHVGAGVGGGSETSYVFSCVANDSECQEALTEAFNNFESNGKKVDVENLTSKYRINDEDDSDKGEFDGEAQKWKGKRYQLEGEAGASIGTGSKENDVAPSVSLSAGLEGSLSWAHYDDLYNDQSKDVESGVLSGEAQAELGIKANGSGMIKDESTYRGDDQNKRRKLSVDVDLPSVYGGASGEVAYDISVLREKKKNSDGSESEEIVGFEIVTAREVHASAGVAGGNSTTGKLSGADNAHGHLKDRGSATSDHSTHSGEDAYQYVSVTTTTLDVNDIEDSDLKKRVQEELDVYSQLLQHPINTGTTIMNGGMYKESVADSEANPLGQALYKHGSSETQVFDADRSLQEEDNGLLVWVNKTTRVKEQRAARERVYLGDIDSQGVRHEKTVSVQ